MNMIQKHINNIQDRFAYLKTRIEMAGSLNLTDIHIFAEDFFKDLFNLLGYSLKNANICQKNCPHIDLIDDVNKKAVQVTSMNNSEKISKTIVGFFENPEHPEFKDYSLEVLLISKNAKDYRTDFTFGGKYKFNPAKDVVDLSRLIERIKDLGKIVEVSKFLDKEILMPRPKTETNDVETIMSLLEFLSDDQNHKDFDGNFICDPDQKINSRFKEYAEDFKEEFTELFPIYCNTNNEAKKAFGLDGVRAQKISCFLKYVSNRCLRETMDNPIDALDKLTDYFEGKLNSNGIKSDVPAIRYYLLDELIGCNIFSTRAD